MEQRQPIARAFSQALRPGGGAFSGEQQATEEELRGGCGTEQDWAAGAAQRSAAEHHPPQNNTSQLNTATGTESSSARAEQNSTAQRNATQHNTTGEALVQHRLCTDLRDEGVTLQRELLGESQRGSGGEGALGGWVAVSGRICGAMGSRMNRGAE